VTILPAIVIAASLATGAVAAQGPGIPNPTTAPVIHAPAEPRAATSRVSGTARWYDYRPGHAAAGPRLRRALGKQWRGSLVHVCTQGRCVKVRLSDWCRCTSGSIIDLDVRSFARLADPSRGVIKVTVSR
jgi:hypothetical protein